MASKIEMSIDENDEKTTPELTEEQQLEIFEQRFKMFMNELSEQCENNNVQVALAVLIDPDYPATPMVFRKGHIWDQAKLASQLARNIKDEVDKELQV